MTKLLNRTEVKAFVDNKLQVAKMGTFISHMIEKVVRKGESTGYRHFLPAMFPKQALVSTCLQYKSFENTVGKGQTARNEQFLLFPQCFLTIWRTFCHFHQI